MSGGLWLHAGELRLAGASHDHSHGGGGGGSDGDGDSNQRRANQRGQRWGHSLGVDKLLAFTGGRLSGWATVFADGAMVVNGSAAKTMRTAVRLELGRDGQGEWAGAGPVRLSEGASWVVS